MPTIKDKLSFNFDGRWSDEFKVINVVLDNGMYDETFVASREINETKVKGNNKPTLHSVEESPLEFELNLAFEREYTDTDIDAIINWLFTDYYKPLYFRGKEDRVYMAMPVSEPKIVHNGLNEGYLTLTMRCDSSNLYSPVVTLPITNVLGTAVITIENDGHYELYPEISITKKGAGTITIESLSNGGEIFEIRDLTDLEDLYINCQKEIIETDIVGVYRYDNVIGEFPVILKGLNQFNIIGDCNIQFRYKKKYKF